MKQIVLSAAALLALSTAAFAGGGHHQSHMPGMMGGTSITAVGGPAQANSNVGVKFTGGTHNAGFGQIVNSSWARGGNAFAGQGGFSGYMW